MGSSSQEHFQTGVNQTFAKTDPGDIPLAFVITLTATSPFTAHDQALGVAYVSIILVWCFLTMFPFGGWTWIKRDFERPEPTSSESTVGREPPFKRLKRAFDSAKTLRIRWKKGKEVDEEYQPADEEKSAELKSSDTLQPSVTELEVFPAQVRTSDIVSSGESHEIAPAVIPSPRDSPSSFRPLPQGMTRKVLKFLVSLISPPSVAILFSLVIALVPQLKALFVANVPGVNMPNAPDGLPPLAWILDIATFGGTSPRGLTKKGAASVPSGLIVLGGSLATLNIRRGLPPW
jgi:auxin efflux carrier family protein